MHPEKKKWDEMRKKRTARKTSKQARECLSEGGERKMHLGRKKGEKSKQGI